jgi:vacuolar protein sorting-associated protein 35
VEQLNQLIKRIQEELPQVEQGEEAEQIHRHFNNTLEHIRIRLDSQSDLGNNANGETNGHDGLRSYAGVEL